MSVVIAASGAIAFEGRDRDEEEDKIMRAESEILKSQISKTSSTPTQKKEYLIRKKLNK